MADEVAAGSPEKRALPPLPTLRARRARPGIEEVRSWHALWHSIWPSINFLFQTEVHVYSFAVAANLLLSFFPFLVVMITLCKSVFHWQAAVKVIFQLVNDYFPQQFGVNFKSYLLSATEHEFSWLSLLLLCFTANGVFEPMEVALNRIWRIETNRSYLRNQIISLGLIFLCGFLTLASISLTTWNTQLLVSTLHGSHSLSFIQQLAFKIIALPMNMVLIFLIYWLLPNAKLPKKRLIAASVLVGLALEGLKYLNFATWPWLRQKLLNEVPPFVQSISIILWAVCASMIILAGAEWSARVKVTTLADAEAPEPIPQPSQVEVN